MEEHLSRVELTFMTLLLFMSMNMTVTMKIEGIQRIVFLFMWIFERVYIPLCMYLDSDGEMYIIHELLAALSRIRIMYMRVYHSFIHSLPSSKHTIHTPLPLRRPDIHTLRP
jgi:hypothetical protein